MKLMVFKGAWQRSEDLFRRIREVLGVHRGLSVDDLNKDPFVLVIEHQEGDDLEKISAVGGRVAKIPRSESGDPRPHHIYQEGGLKSGK